MPLTFAHPAAVLPLARLRLPLSGLVVGSMAPDFVYFVRLAPRGHFGHTLPGLVLFCLPAGLVVLWMFHRLIKRQIAELSPVAAQRRLAAPLLATPFDRPLGIVAAAVLLGAITHVVWDAFTHATGGGVAAVPALRHTVSVGPTLRLPAYKLAQHSSTAIGLTVLGAALVRWWRQALETDIKPRLPPRARWWRLSLLVALPLLLAVGYAGTIAGSALEPLPVFAGRLATSAPGFAFVTAAAYSLWRRSRSA